MAKAGMKKAGTKKAGTKKVATKVARRATKPAARAAKSKHKISINHLDPKAFKPGGLRGHAAYRDLGISKATNGMVQAHVTHLAPGVKLSEAISTPHYHNLKFQMVYCLKGWMRLEFEGHGQHTMRAGSCWLQPPGVTHWIVDRSEDYEVLEIVMPAEFETVTL